MGIPEGPRLAVAFPGRAALLASGTAVTCAGSEGGLEKPASGKAHLVPTFHFHFQPGFFSFFPLWATVSP